MELYEALGQISEIRAKIARTETFRGYRSLTVGFSGVLGMAVAAVQSYRIPTPMEHVWSFVNLWVSVAIVSLLVVGIELAYRCSVATSPLTQRLTVLAIQQFAPCLLAGAAFTVVLAKFAPEAAWMLPGLWAILFSLGVFASCRLLPRATLWVGVHYLVSGTLCLAIAAQSHTLSPWMMVGTFGLGQLLGATILYYTLERRHEQFEA